MEKYRKMISRMRLQTFPLLGVVAFITFFGVFWGSMALVLASGAEKIFALIPLPMIGIILAVFLNQLKGYVRSMRALKYGEETTGVVLSVGRNYSSNASSMCSLKVRYTNKDGQEIIGKTMSCYYHGEARELEGRGTVSIKYFKNGIFITEEIEGDYSPLAEMKRVLEAGGRGWNHEYNYQREARARNADTVFGGAEASAAGSTPTKAAQVQPKDEQLRRLADLGVPYASDLLALSGYERLRFCALNKVVGEVRTAIEQDMNVMTDEEHLQACIEWYRGLRRDIENGSLEDAIVLVDFFDYFLESEETMHSIELVLEKSKDVEPYMLASRTVRKLKQYKRVLELCSEISSSKDVNSIITLIKNNADDIGSLLAFVGATARGAVTTTTDKNKITAALKELGGE